MYPAHTESRLSDSRRRAERDRAASGLRSVSGTSRANASRPACHWTHFPAGTLPSVERYTRGSFGLVENYPDYLLADVIRAGQREYLHFKGRHALPYCNVTHAFGIVAEDGGIVEALANGVWRHSIKEYRDTDTFIVQPRVAARERDACASLWESAVGTRYDYLDYVTDLVPLALIGLLDVLSGFVRSG